MKSERIKELVSDERGRELLFLIIGSLVSSESLSDLDSCVEALGNAKLFKSEILDSNIKDKERYMKLLDDVIPIIERDIKMFSK